LNRTARAGHDGIVDSALLGAERFEIEIINA
jgi:hypothetical protein